MNLKFTTRAAAMDRYVDAGKIKAMETAEEAGISYSDPRKNWHRFRNYEIESRLHEQSREKGDDDVWIVTQWCPFDGIFCSYFDVANLQDLNETLRVHRATKSYVAPFVFNDIEDAIKLRGNRDEKAYYIEGFKAEEEEDEEEFADG